MFAVSWTTCEDLPCGTKIPPDDSDRYAAAREESWKSRDTCRFQYFCNVSRGNPGRYDPYSMVTQPGLRRDPQIGSRAAGEKAIFRRWQRFRLNLPVRLIVTRDEGTRIAEGRANDISEGGMLIFAGTELRADDKVVVEFTPPYSSSPVRAPGIVRHRRGYNYGVEFRAETRADQEQIEKFRNLLHLAAGDLRP